MSVSRVPCQSCGVDLVWLLDLDHRPFEATPTEPCDGDIGWVVVRRAGRLLWEPSWWHPTAPEHVRVHHCYAWRENRRTRVHSVAAVLDELTGAAS